MKVDKHPISSERIQNTHLARIETQLNAMFSRRRGGAERLLSAMRYSVLNGGKRLRASFVYTAAEIVSDQQHCPLTDAAAMAVELVHAYSLIHDDLPAMDNDDLRRGKPSCHKAFDEATAILAGDSLQTLAFDLLSDSSLSKDSALQLYMVRVLASAIGDLGMCSGQAEDLWAQLPVPHNNLTLKQCDLGKKSDLGLDKLTRIHRLKTGALIKASVHLGLLSVACKDSAISVSLLNFAETMGLAFQIRDDILDVVGESAVMGKARGSDAAGEKATFVTELGLEHAQLKMSDLHRQALRNLDGLGDKANHLRYLAGLMVDRHS